MLYFCTDLTVIRLPMELFQVDENGRVSPSTHALMVQPFRAIWQEDTSLGRGEAEKAFRFIELYCSPKKSNPFSGYIDKDVRYTKVKEEVYGDASHELDHLVIDGIAKYEELLDEASPSYSFLKAAFSVAGKLKRHYESVDLDERTSSGALVYKWKEVTAALSDTENVVRNLENVRNKVNEEILNQGKTRNNRQVGYFEE